MKKSGVIILCLSLFLSLFLIGVISALSCSITTTCAAENTVMKMYGTGNTHGALWNDAGATHYLCCDTTGTHTCDGNNNVVDLSSSSNAHVETPRTSTSNDYTTEVCFGNLRCDHSTASCGSSSIEIFSISDYTNAHIGSVGEFTSTPPYTRICCSEVAPATIYYLCNDSDGGSTDFTTKGTITYESFGNIVTSEDYCEYGLLREKYCSGNSPSTNPHDCSNEGHVCIDGACVTCTPDCTNKNCGSDGCVGSCGTCSSGEFCDVGVCSLDTRNANPYWGLDSGGSFIEITEGVELSTKSDGSFKNNLFYMIIEDSGLSDGAIDFEVFENDLINDDDIRTGGDVVVGSVLGGVAIAVFNVEKSDVIASGWTWDGSEYTYGAEGATLGFYFKVNDDNNLKSDPLDVTEKEDLCRPDITMCSDYNSDKLGSLAQAYCENNNPGAGQCNVDNEECIEGDSSICTWDIGTSSCEPACKQEIACGNNRLDPGEECEIGDTSSTTCPGATISCLDNCMWDKTSCPSICETGGSNGNLEDGEECDFPDLGGLSCITSGRDTFTGGLLGCYDNCLLDVSSCVRCEVDGYCNSDGTCDSYLGECALNCPADCYCGNPTVDPGEECEIGDSGLCEDGTTTKSCESNCMWDVSSCSNPWCDNDGIIETGEECDGSNLGLNADRGVLTCETSGRDTFTGGTLACNNNCLFDLGGCDRIDVDVTPAKVGTCYYQETSTDNCDDGFLSYSWEASWVWALGNEILNYDPTDRALKCEDGSNTIACPAQIQLPFFNLFNLMVTLLVVGIVYYVLNSRGVLKKFKKKKSSKK
jgi:hypothetical protein